MRDDRGQLFEAYAFSHAGPDRRAWHAVATRTRGSSLAPKAPLGTARRRHVAPRYVPCGPPSDATRVFEAFVQRRRFIRDRPPRSGGYEGILDRASRRSEASYGRLGSPPPRRGYCPGRNRTCTRATSRRAGGVHTSPRLWVVRLRYTHLKGAYSVSLATDRRSAPSSVSTLRPGRARLATRRALAAISESGSHSGSPPRSKPTAARTTPASR
jgi:hypothetical protein